FIFIKGDFTRPGAPVTPGVIEVLHPFVRQPARAVEGTNRTLTSSAPSSATSTRLELARWLVAPENPLLARVQVNRVWQEYFGRGLVETENDFGTQGSPP